jgi:hypothetical protein
MSYDSLIAEVLEVRTMDEFARANEALLFVAAFVSLKKR